MSSLARCLEIHGKSLSALEIKALNDAADAYRKEGFKAEVSNASAVEDILKDLESERADIVSQVLKQKPELKAVFEPETEKAPVKEPVKAIEKPEAKKESGKLEDFGEKIGGARKDVSGFVQKELTDEDIASQPLSEIWPKSQVDSIEDNDLAAIATAIRGEIPNKPRTSYKLRRWVEQVKTVKELMRFAEEMGGEKLIKKMSEQSGLAGLLSKIKVLQKIDRNDWKRIGDVGEHPDAYSYGKGTERIPSPYVSVEIDGKRATFKAKSISEIEDQIKERLAGEAPGKKLKFEVRGYKGKYQINKVGDPLYRPLKTFAELNEAREYRINNNDALTLAWEQLKENENVKETDVRKKENRPRVGADHRKGKDATPEMFMESFGFRGVEFGNWVSQGKNIKERQGMLNAAYDALYDLSDILDIPTKAISLNGELGLGLGSRGHGWASAHYEPDFVVINLTKTRGAGAIAHEFFHALDHYFHRMRGSKTNFAHGNYITFSPETYYQNDRGYKIPASRFKELSDKKALKPSEWTKIEDKVRPEVSEAFKDLVDAINASPMSKRSALIDKGKSGGYWSRIIERAARSFENYVIAKMAEKGYHNDYLANVAAIESFARDPGRYPYLLAEELPPIEKAFDNLFATVETKETDKGVAIFKKRTISESKGKYKQAKLEKLINNRVKGWTNAPKFEVVGKQSQLPQPILDAIKADTIVDAVLYKGTAYLVAENLGGPKHALNALFHESFGEHGLRLLENDPVVGPEYKAFETKLLETHKTAISKIAKEYNLDMSNERQASIAAKEYLSREAAKEAVTGPIRRLIRLIKRWLSEIVPSLKSQRDDIRQWLRDARTAVESGLPGEVAGEPAYSSREGMPVFQTHTEERPKEPSAFEKGKDDWFGNKDWAEQQHTVEAGKIQEDIRKALGYKKKPSFVRHPRKRTAQDNHVRDVDSAIHIYLDLKRNPEHLNEYYDSLTDKQKKIADIAQTIDDNPKLKEIADHIDGEYRKIGKMSFDEGLIHNVLENYVSRAWRLDKGHSTEAFRKFGTKTRHRKHRVFETILEGQASGFELLVSGATNNLELLKNEISRTLEDKKLIDELRKTDWEDTEERIVTDTKLKGYEKIEHPNFTYWTFATKVDMKESPVDKAMGLMVGDFVRAYDRDNIGKVTDIQGGSVTVHFINRERGTEATKTFSDTGVGELNVKSIRKVSPKGVNFFIADDGTVLEKRDLYAPEKVAKSLNKILGTSKLKGKPGIDTLTKYNAVFKHWILVSSFFHHLAFMRSYLLGTKGKSLKEWNVNSAKKAGLKAINELSPEIELLVRNGLTLGKVQDWEESILSQEDTIFGEITDKLTRSTKIKDAISSLRQRQADFLFRNFGAGLKAQAALIELRNVRKAQLKRAENGKDAVLDHNEQAKMVANLINDDFGGLHLGRLERDPTIQHIFRLFALAPDWTESNVRTMVKAVRSGGKAETRLYRKFWASVLTKGVTATILANILLGVGDDKDLVEKFKDAWEEGNFRWLGVDITPIYKLLGGETEARKYFSIFGHFKDPMKFITHPIKSAHHKGSVLYRLFHESMAGTDWRGHRFTTISELLGVDDKGVYLTKSKTHKFGEPKGGKMAGKTTVYDSGKKGPIEIAQIPSYIIAQVKGAQPIQLQNLMGWMQGEIEGFDAIGRSVGANTTSTYPNRKKMMKEFVDTYVSLKGQGKRVTSLFASVKLYNKRQRARGEKEEVIPMESIVRAGNKKIGANRIQGRP